MVLMYTPGSSIHISQKYIIILDNMLVIYTVGAKITIVALTGN